MSNDKKPKKAKPTVVHGTTAASRGNQGSTLLAPPKSALNPAKKKK